MPTLRKFIQASIAYSCLLPIVAAQLVKAQDFSRVVVPVASVRIRPSLKVGLMGKPEPLIGLNANFGTGFCLDAECSFIVTNYHVALLVRPHKIGQEKIVNRYFATGPKDNGATANNMGRGVLAYVMQRDLAMFELRHKLGHHYGPAFSVEELRHGQEVDIYGYPSREEFRKRKLTRFRATFNAPTTSGLLAFDFQGYAGPVRVEGASGGIIVDRETGKIVGILTGVSPDARGAVAVSVPTLVDFVTKVQPFLAQKLFPSSTIKEISPFSADLYPKFVPVRSDGLQRRPGEPYEVGVVRQKAQLLADSIRNFIAVQTYAWGSGDKAPDVRAAYEVRVIDGAQWFRSYPDGNRESEDIPSPPRSAWVLPANEWSKLPKMIGTQLRLNINQAPNTVANERRIKVFQYYASVEDDVCSFESVGFINSKTIVVPCHGEVWTDEELNILRISERLDFSDKLKAQVGWRNVGVVVTYSSLTQPGESPRLVPWTIFTEASDKSHVYWCRGNFTDYREFRVGARLITEEARSPE